MLLDDYLKDKFVIAGTGSRSFDMNVHVEEWDRLVRHIRINKESHDNLVVMSGAAQGWDAAVAEAAYWDDVPYVLCIPNKGYGPYYWKDDYEDFQSMVDSAAQVEYTMEEVHGTSKLYLGGLHANFHRNNRMVALANAFLVYGPSSRGTSQCLMNIREKGTPFKVLGG